MYIEFQQNCVVDQSKPCTQIYLQMILSCINLQLAFRKIAPFRHGSPNFLYLSRF